MTEKEYLQYKHIKDEIDELKDFLAWCGNKYHCLGISHYRAKLKKKRKFLIGRVGCGAIGDTELELPSVLQDRIIEIMENYVDEKQKELDEL